MHKSLLTHIKQAKQHMLNVVFKKRKLIAIDKRRVLRKSIESHTIEDEFCINIEESIRSQGKNDASLQTLMDRKMKNKSILIC